MTKQTFIFCILTGGKHYKMKLLNKIKWVLGILMIFVLIIATNLIDRNNFLRVKDSVVTIYEDRLVVNDIIFDFSRYIHEKEIALITSDSLFYANRNLEINENVQNLITRYEETKLTKEESQVFNSFKENMALLKSQEQSLGSTFDKQDSVKNSINDVKKNLADLSKIQLVEGARQMNISKKAIDTVELFTRIEIYILIFLGVLVQIIIIYNPKEA